LRSVPTRAALRDNQGEVRDVSGEPALLNLSTRARVHAGEAIVTGFVVGGTAERRVLFRAIGPTLGHFGINDPIARPKLEVYSDEGTRTGEFMTWGGDEKLAALFASVGAFALPRTSNDAATVLTLAPGAYTVVLKGATPTDEGEVLLEVYSVDRP
jgi:hypothetical protein